MVGRLRLRRLQEVISSRWPELVSAFCCLRILLLYANASSFQAALDRRTHSRRLCREGRDRPGARLRRETRADADTTSSAAALTSASVELSVAYVRYAWRLPMASLKRLCVTAPVATSVKLVENLARSSSRDRWSFRNFSRRRQFSAASWPSRSDFDDHLLLLGDESFALSDSLFGLSKSPQENLPIHVPRLRRIHQRPRDRDE